jgi:uncharacterized membrane protein
MSDVKNVVTNWLWHVAAKKAVVTICQVIVAWFCAQGLDKLLGITIDVNQLALGILAALEMLRNWLKVKFGWKWL